MTARGADASHVIVQRADQVLVRSAALGARKCISVNRSYAPGNAPAVFTLVSRFSLVSVEPRKAWVELKRGYMLLKGPSHVR